MAAPVQHAEALLGSSAASATVSLTGTAAGAPVVVCLALDKDAGTVALDAASATAGWQLPQQGSNPGAQDDVINQVTGAMAYLISPGGNVSCTLTWPRAKPGAVTIDEYAPLTGTALDVKGQNYQGTNAVTRTTGLTITADAPTTAAGLAVAMLGIDTGSSIGTASWSGGFTNRDYAGEAQAGAGLAVADAEVASGSTPSTTVTWTTANDQVYGGMLVFRTLAGAPAATIDHTYTLGLGATGFSARAKVANVNPSAARLVVSTTADLLTSPVYGAYASPDANGTVVASVSGLAEKTQYYYGWELNGTLVADTAAGRGEAKTQSAAAAAMTVAFASCAATNSNSAAFANILTRRPDLLVHLGDGNYTNPTSTDPAYYRSLFNAEIAQTNPKDLMRKIPSQRVPGDHDYHYDTEAAVTHAGRLAANTAYKQYFPGWTYFDTAADGALGCWTELNGVLIIMLDTASQKSPEALAESDPAKTILGATQKAAYKSLVSTAANKAKPKLVFSPVPWNANGVDNWGGHEFERQELIDFHVANGVTNLIICTGDMHAVASDDGRNTPGGYPNFAAAPFDQTASQKGGPYQYGPIPATGTAQVYQYGWIDVTWPTATTCRVRFNGHDSTGAALLTEQDITLTTGAAPPTVQPAHDRTLIPGEVPDWFDENTMGLLGNAAAEAVSEESFFGPQGPPVTYYDAPARAQGASQGRAAGQRLQAAPGRAQGASQGRAPSSPLASAPARAQGASRGRAASAPLLAAAARSQAVATARAGSSLLASAAARSAGASAARALADATTYFQAPARSVGSALARARASFTGSAPARASGIATPRANGQILTGAPGKAHGRASSRSAQAPMLAAPARGTAASRASAASAPLLSAPAAAGARSAARSGSSAVLSAAARAAGRALTRGLGATSQILDAPARALGRAAGRARPTMDASAPTRARGTSAGAGAPHALLSAPARARGGAAGAAKASALLSAPARAQGATSARWRPGLLLSAPAASHALSRARAALSPLLASVARAFGRSGADAWGEEAPPVVMLDAPARASGRSGGSGRGRLDASAVGRAVGRSTTGGHGALLVAVPARAFGASTARGAHSPLVSVGGMAPALALGRAEAAGSFVASAPGRALSLSGGRGLPFAVVWRAAPDGDATMRVRLGPQELVALRRDGSAVRRGTGAPALAVRRSR